MVKIRPPLCFILCETIRRPPATLLNTRTSRKIILEGSIATAPGFGFDPGIRLLSLWGFCSRSFRVCVGFFWVFRVLPASQKHRPIWLPMNWRSIPASHRKVATESEWELLSSSTFCIHCCELCNVLSLTTVKSTYSDDAMVEKHQPEHRWVSLSACRIASFLGWIWNIPGSDLLRLFMHECSQSLRCCLGPVLIWIWLSCMFSSRSHEV